MVDTSALMERIRHGVALRRVETVDKSRPIIVADNESLKQFARGSGVASSTLPKYCVDKFDAQDRGALLEQIRSGVKLKPVARSNCLKEVGRKALEEKVVPISNYRTPARVNGVAEGTPLHATVFHCDERATLTRTAAAEAPPVVVTSYSDERSATGKVRSECHIQLAPCQRWPPAGVVLEQSRECTESTTPKRIVNVVSAKSCLTVNLKPTAAFNYCDTLKTSKRNNVPKISKSNEKIASNGTHLNGQQSGKMSRESAGEDLEHVADAFKGIRFEIDVDDSEGRYLKLRR